MVGARAPATRPRPGQFAQGSAPRKSLSRPALERIPPHYGPGRRAIEDKRTLKSHRHSSLVTSCSAFQNFSFQRLPSQPLNSSPVTPLSNEGGTSQRSSRILNAWDVALLYVL